MRGRRRRRRVARAKEEEGRREIAFRCLSSSSPGWIYRAWKVSLAIGMGGRRAALAAGVGYGAWHRRRERTVHQGEGAAGEIGNWSRWLTDCFGMEVYNIVEDEENDNPDGDGRLDDARSKCFRLLNELSDLLMLPKDMLLERTVRKEVCPSIGLPLLTRILCNFMPDEFCPDPVPGIVLECLNNETLIERRISDNEHQNNNSFPCTASQVAYTPPSLSDLAEKVSEAGSKSSNLQRSASIVQRKGYTSDEDLDNLDDPLASIIDRTPPISPAISGDRTMQKSLSSLRYKLLRQVWSD